MTQKSIRPKEIIRRRNRLIRWVTTGLLVMAIGTALRWSLMDRRWVTTDDAFVTANVVVVKAQTEGTVIEVLIENTQYVERGQLLARLDGRQAEITLGQAEAELAASVRRIAALTARQETLKHRLAMRMAELLAVKHDLLRLQQAVKDEAVSNQELQNHQDKRRKLEAAVAASMAEQHELAARLGTSDLAEHPEVQAAKQRVRKSYVDYQRRNVVAPAAGYVAKRKVQIGDRVLPGSLLLSVVPLDQLWVEANVLENKLARIRPGQEAEIHLDAYPDRIYHGRVEGLNPGTGSVFALLPTDNATGNFIHIAERIPIRIALDSKELAEAPLQPGLSTVTRIDLSSPGLATLQSTATLGKAVSRTDMFDRELDGIEPILTRIVELNSHGP